MKCCTRGLLSAAAVFAILGALLWGALAHPPGKVGAAELGGGLAGGSSPERSCLKVHAGLPAAASVAAGARPPRACPAARPRREPFPETASPE
jgi:hypothetical protein